MTRAQAEGALDEHARAKADGRRIALPALLIKRGYLPALVCRRLCTEIDAEKSGDGSGPVRTSGATTPRPRAAEPKADPAKADPPRSKTSGVRPSRAPARPLPRGSKSSDSMRGLARARPGAERAERPVPASSAELEADTHTDSDDGTTHRPGGDLATDRLQPTSAPEAVVSVLEADLPGLKVIEQIGSGSMGFVFRARQRMLGRHVALKVLSTDGVPPAAVERFRDEALLAARLRHGNIAWVLGTGAAPGFLYIIMEYVKGRDLAAILADRGPLPEFRALEVAAKIADALEHVHGKGVVHQDVKPSNVIVREDGEPVLSDFGLAASLDGDHGVAHHKTLFGTYPYLPPEDLLRGRRTPSAAGDLYALGVTLFRMLTGELPYGCSDVLSLREAIRKRGCPDLEGRAPAPLAPLTREALRLALEVRPRRRFESAQAMAHALREAQSDLTS